METVIVTLRSEGFEKDMELPCRIPLEELYPRLTTALQNASTLRFGDFIVLRFIMVYARAPSLTL